jgi:hypothetical protein
VIGGGKQGRPRPGNELKSCRKMRSSSRRGGMVMMMMRRRRMTIAIAVVAQSCQTIT